MNKFFKWAETQHTLYAIVINITIFTSLMIWIGVLSILWSLGMVFSTFVVFVLPMLIFWAILIYKYKHRH